VCWVLQLFGPPVLPAPGGDLRWRRETRFRLLACLAVQARPVDRDQLAFTFWPDQPHEDARRHLRKTWFRLRGLPALTQAAPLQSDAATLAWTPASDLARWQDLLRQGDLRAAVALYRGPLLQGLDGGSPEFDRWLAFERERFARQQRAAVLDLLPALQPGEHTQALAWVDQLLEQDALDEAAAAARVQLLAASGQSAAARRFELDWGRQLRDELGVEPPALVRAAPAPLPAPAGVLGTPQYLTSFVGRRAELAAIAAWLAAAERGGERLLTLLGPPGSGKSRLAAEAVERLDAPGVARRLFVELDRLPPVTAADSPRHEAEFVMHLAGAAGLVLVEGEMALERLADALARPPTLLVLDNLEHRAADRAVLQRLLRVPTLRLLCTSRLRLDLDGEQLLELGGLRDDALPLFLARSGGSLPGPARADALRLCDLLQGQPLAIELAARQCRGLSPAELHERVTADLDTLRDDSPAAPPRQRSLRAAFDTSWRLLPAPLQQALLPLSVLRADFSRDAARAVAGVSDAALSALVGHSLLRTDPASGRLRWHPFVREFALARLAADGAAMAAVQQGHVAWFVHRLRLLDLREEHPSPAGLREAALEAENLVDAWHHALAHGRHDAWETLAEALALHYEIHARYREGAALLSACEGGSGSADRRRAAARVAVLRARLLHWLSNELADDVAAAAEAALEAAGDAAGLIGAWRVRAVVAWRRGSSTEALALFRRALALGERSGFEGKQAILLDGMGLALLYLGDAEGSRAAFERALALNERSGNGLQRVHNLINLSLDARARTPPQAMALARRALALAREIGFHHYVPHGLVTQAMAHLGAGDAAAARALALQAADITRRSGDSYVESWALARGLDLSWQDQDLGLVAQHLALAAEWLAAAGRQEAAAAVLATLRAQASLPDWLRRQTAALAAGLPATPARPDALAAQCHRMLGELAAHATPNP